MAATKRGTCPDCGQGNVNWHGPCRGADERTLKCDNCATETVVTKD